MWWEISRQIRQNRVSGKIIQVDSSSGSCFEWNYALKLRRNEHYNSRCASRVLYMPPGWHSLCIQSKHHLLLRCRLDSGWSPKTGAGSAHLKHKRFSIRFSRLFNGLFPIGSWLDFILVFTDIWFCQSVSFCTVSGSASTNLRISSKRICEWK